MRNQRRMDAEVWFRRVRPPRKSITRITRIRRGGRAKTRLRKALRRGLPQNVTNDSAGPRQTVATAGLGAPRARFVTWLSRAGFEPCSCGCSSRSLPELTACGSYKFFGDGESWGRGSKPARTNDRNKGRAVRAEFFALPSFAVIRRAILSHFLGLLQNPLFVTSSF